MNKLMVIGLLSVGLVSCGADLKLECAKSFTLLQDYRNTEDNDSKYRIGKSYDKLTEKIAKQVGVKDVGTFCKQLKMYIQST